MGVKSRRTLRAEVTYLKLTCIDAEEGVGRRNRFRHYKEDGRGGGAGRAAREKGVRGGAGHSYELRACGWRWLVRVPYLKQVKASF